MTEEQLLESVLELAVTLGVLPYHTRDSRRSQPGFPDLVLAGRTSLLFVELKSASGRLQLDQTQWRYQLQASGQLWRLWRPADWRDGSILAEMKAIA